MNKIKGSTSTKWPMAVMIMAAAIGTGCITKTGTGALLGGAVGALAGQAIGKDTKGTLIGAGVGAAIGGAIGNQEDTKDKNKKLLHYLKKEYTIFEDD